MIVDTIEHIGQIGLRIEAIHLGRFDDRHGTRQCLRTGVCAGKEPIFPSNSNRAQGSLSSIVVDRDTAVLQEQAE